MPDPTESSRRALNRLDRRLSAFEASRKVGTLGSGLGGEAGDGYRLLGQMLGGVLGGVGLGWLLDQFAHTGPWGVLGGLAIGSAGSIYATVRTASRMSARMEQHPASGAAAGDEDEDET
jgi:ATP synthase protein I